MSIIEFVSIQMSNLNTEVIFLRENLRTSAHEQETIFSLDLTTKGFRMIDVGDDCPINFQYNGRAEAEHRP
jgi:hypothetical protein